MNFKSFHHISIFIKKLGMRILLWLCFPLSALGIPDSSLPSDIPTESLIDATDLPTRVTSPPSQYITQQPNYDLSTIPTELLTEIPSLQPSPYITQQSSTELPVYLSYSPWEPSQYISQQPSNDFSAIPTELWSDIPVCLSRLPSLEPSQYITQPSIDLTSELPSGNPILSTAYPTAYPTASYASIEL